MPLNPPGASVEGPSAMGDGSPLLQRRLEPRPKSESKEGGFFCVFVVSIYFTYYTTIDESGIILPSYLGDYVNIFGYINIQMFMPTTSEDFSLLAQLVQT